MPIFHRGTRNKIWGAALGFFFGMGTVAIVGAATPGSTSDYMLAHQAAIQKLRGAETNPTKRAAYDDELAAICGYLGNCAKPSTTTTTRPSTTTTTVTSTTTIAPTTTSVQPTTTSVTVPPSTTTTVMPSTGCTLQLATSPLSFCDTFSTTAGADPATRAGDLDAVVWGVSRTNTHANPFNPTDGFSNDWAAATLPSCGATVQVLPPRDVRICNGRLIEAVNDEESQTILAMYPKQPFDIAGRTGTVGFDVSADSQGPHAAWPEFWWTDKPVPAPHAGELSAQSPFARNSFGFAIGNGGPCTSINDMNLTRNYIEEKVAFTPGACIQSGSVTGALNHIEIRMSASRVEVYGTDAGSTTLKLMASADLVMPMTRGLIWLEDVHYNANKFDTQGDHAFAWDNLAWDGPRPYRDLSFDVPDANHQPSDQPATIHSLGWLLQGNNPSPVLSTVPVFRLQTPTSALVTFNWFPTSNTVPSFRLNNGPLHTVTWPFAGDSFTWRTIDVAVPVSEVQDGVNTIQFSNGNDAVLSNVNVILVAASA